MKVLSEEEVESLIKRLHVYENHDYPVMRIIDPESKMGDTILEEQYEQVLKRLINDHGKAKDYRALLYSRDCMIENARSSLVFIRANPQLYKSSKDEEISNTRLTVLQQLGSHSGVSLHYEKSDHKKYKDLSNGIKDRIKEIESTDVNTNTWTASQFKRELQGFLEEKK